MKKMLGISLIALFAAAPMVANAAAVAGDPVTYTIQPTGADRTAVVGGQPLYQLAQSAATDTNAASAGYVKGAYNAAIKGVNKVHDEAVAAQSTANATAATISGYGDIVTHSTSEFATSAQGAKADTALQSTSALNGANLTDSTVTKAKLATAVQSSLDKADSALQSTSALNGANLTDSTVTKAKLATAVQSSLDKADTALQSSDIATSLDSTSNAKAAGTKATYDAIATAKSEAVTAAGSATTSAIQALDSTVSQTTGDLSVTVEEADGKLSSVSASINNSAVTTAKIADSAVTKAKLATAVQSSLDKADTALQSSDIATSLDSTSNAKAAGTKATYDAINAATGSKTGVSLDVSIASQTISASGLTVSVPTSASYNIMQTWGSDSATSGTYALAGGSTVNVAGSATLSAISTSATGDISGIDISYSAQ